MVFSCFTALKKCVVQHLRDYRLDSVIKMWSCSNSFLKWIHRSAVCRAASLVYILLWGNESPEWMVQSRTSSSILPVFTGHLITLTGGQIYIGQRWNVKCSLACFIRRHKFQVLLPVDCKCKTIKSDIYCCHLYCEKCLCSKTEIVMV